MVGAAGRALSASPEEWFSRVHLSDLPQLKVDIAACKDLEERLRREAQFDTLTGLPNRGYATDLLQRAPAR
jgi:PleD family two-component response regulator